MVWPTALVCLSTVLTGGRPVLPDDEPLPPRTRVYFFNEDGYAGVWEYPPITEYIDMLRDFDCGWPFPVASYQLVLRTPLYFRREALNLGYRVRIAALSFRDLSQAQPLCVVDDSLLSPSRPYLQCLKATWMHTWQITEHCFRWIADIPRFLSGKHIFCLLDGDCLTGEETYYVGQGSFFYLPFAQGDHELLICHARSTLAFVCSNDETFFPERDDNRRGLTAGAELSQADFGKLVQKIKALQLGFQPAQIRAVLLADSKTCTKLSKGLEASATKDSFLAAAKRLGLTPKLVASPTTSADSTPPPPDDEGDGWHTVPKKGGPKAKPKAGPGPPRPPTKPRRFALVPEGWSVPFFLLLKLGLMPLASVPLMTKKLPMRHGLAVKILARPLPLWVLVILRWALLLLKCSTVKLTSKLAPSTY